MFYTGIWVFLQNFNALSDQQEKRFHREIGTMNLTEKVKKAFYRDLVNLY